MDITGKEEDEVATALFDAGWDENRAVEILLEGGSSHGAWEESGGKKKKQLKQAAEEKVKCTEVLAPWHVKVLSYMYLINKYLCISKSRTKTGTTTVSRTPERNPGAVERLVADQLHGAAEVKDPTPTETSSMVKGAAAEEVCAHITMHF